MTSNGLKLELLVGLAGRKRCMRLYKGPPDNTAFHALKSGSRNVR